MTVCIAAIYGKNKGIIAVADKMFTSAPGILTVHEVSENNKIFQLTDSCIALAAGNVANASSIVTQLMTAVKPDDSIKEIADKSVKIYQSDLKLALENGALSRWGLSLQEFMTRQRELDENLVSNLNKVIYESSLGVELIIAGMDAGGPSLYFIDNPGNSICLNSNGIAFAGSGGAHASLSTVASRYQMSDNYGKTLYSAYKAKKKAEYDPNVGKYTSVAVINESIKVFTDDEVRKLNEKYQEGEEQINAIIDTVTNSLGEFLNGNTSSKKKK